MKDWLLLTHCISFLYRQSMNPVVLRTKLVVMTAMTLAAITDVPRCVMPICANLAKFATQPLLLCKTAMVPWPLWISQPVTMLRILCYCGTLVAFPSFYSVTTLPSTKVSLSWFIPFLIYLKLAAETWQLFEYFVNRRQHVIKMFQKGRVSSRLDSSHWDFPASKAFRKFTWGIRVSSCDCRSLMVARKWSLSLLPSSRRWHER